MNNDLISREALKKAINELGIPIYGKMVLKAIDNAPTIEYPFYAEAYQTGYEEGKNERPQGEWVTVHFLSEDDVEIPCVQCSNCKLHFDIGTKFCPNCGADMRGGAEE